MEKSVLVNDSLEKIFTQASRIAQFQTTVLIEGETGVGKEVLSEWIHKQSPRSNMPFIRINCGAIPETLLESELFGYERGAFTGAKTEGNPGLFELADKGTLLLDEVGELSPTLQVKLLRVLQDHEIRRVGGTWTKTINVRVLASTNRDLRQMVKAHLFREDLYYRLNVVTLTIPPLRQRREDILSLINQYLEKFNRDYGMNKQLAPQTLQLLLNYDYPGNVRELQNLIEGLCVRCESDLLTSDYLPFYIKESYDSLPSDLTLTEETESEPELLPLHIQVEEAERRALQQALKQTNSIRKAAKKLEISHATLLRKMSKYNLSPSSDYGD